MPYFDAIVDGNEVTKAKPDPEVFLKAALLLESKPEECVVFEDSVAGVQAANIAHMLSVGVGEASILHEADFLISTFEDIDEKLWHDLHATNKLTK
jgi:beta-phosphoglucomutase